ncbi:hypothetical protein U9M48_031416 [Paspalum notatum var. saurae]|uniref:DUF4219 domain-containing protein n=1 Tax=Paspalum notatum var. saurae TaxID=547442 RepID=A0AAQ3U300_PASNO
MARKGMVRGLPAIEHVSELCDSLAGKQRRSPFPKATSYRAKDLPELVHGDLCGPIKPVAHGGKRYFLLLVDDSSRFMEHLLSYITGGDDSQALGSLFLFATLLQTKELDESMLDALGILPQRKQHKKLLLQALVGEDLAERRLFSSSSGLVDDSICSDFDIYVRKLQDKYGLHCHHPRQITSEVHRYQVLDALVYLFCRSNISADVRLVGGWLFRQLLPHGEEEFTAFHLRWLKDSHKDCRANLSEEIGGRWCDMLLPILAIEASSPPKGSKSIIVPTDLCSSGGDSSVAIAERVFEMVKSPRRREQEGSNSTRRSRGGGGGTLVIQRTVRNVGGIAPYPQLARTNYNIWEVMMKVMLEARGLWAAVEAGNVDP